MSVRQVLGATTSVVRADVDIRLHRSSEQQAKDRAEELAMKQAAAEQAQSRLSKLPPLAPLEAAAADGGTGVQLSLIHI